MFVRARRLVVLLVVRGTVDEGEDREVLMLGLRMNGSVYNRGGLKGGMDFFRRMERFDNRRWGGDK